MKKAYTVVFFSILTFFCTLAFTSCHDNIFGTIQDEVALNHGLDGNVTSITQKDGYLYLAAQRKGCLLRRAVNAVGFEEWETWDLNGIEDYYILYVRNNSGSLEVLVFMDYYDDDEQGTRTPKGFRTYKYNGSSWIATNTSYDSAKGSVPPALQQPFTEALMKVTVGGYTYSVYTGDQGHPGTKINGIEMQDDNEVGSIYSISATSDYLLIATHGGLFKVPYNSSTGAIDAANKRLVDEEGYGNVTNIRTNFVYAVDAGTKPYAQSTIYTCRSPASSSQAIKNNGLYAIYRNGSKPNEWNKDGTDE